MTDRVKTVLGLVFDEINVRRRTDGRLFEAHFSERVLSIMLSNIHVEMKFGMERRRPLLNITHDDPMEDDR